MSIDVYPKNIFMYFDKSQAKKKPKAKNLHSIWIARTVRYIGSKIREHSKDYKCHCFKCLVCRMLLTVLISRGHLNLLLILPSLQKIE